MGKEKNKTPKKPLQYLTKVRIVMGSCLIVFILLLSFVYQVVARNFFFLSASTQLGDLVVQTKKNLVSDVTAELKLALQMAKSPLVKSAFITPENETLSSQMKAEMESYASSLESGSTFYVSDKDKVFYLTDGTHYTLDMGNANDSWFKMTMDMPSSQAYNFNVQYNVNLNITNLWINAVVRTQAGRAIGVVGTGIPLTGFIEAIYEDLNSEVDLLFFNDKYEVVGAKDVELIKKNVQVSTIEAPNVLEKLHLFLADSKKTDTLGFKTANTQYYVTSIPELGWYALMSRTCTFNTLFSGISVVIFFVIIVAVMGLMGLVYTALVKFQKMRVQEQSLGNNLFEETQNLVVAAKETAATSQDQSAAVKEIVATMEDSNNLSENISDKIEDVAMVAKKTSTDVMSGASTLATNVRKLREINEANSQTINGIKALSEKIDNIWDIVTLINSVADQAKIIAFNAELEASSAGEAGKNFHIVASEIRRLADGIIDGTKEIKERINEIQQSSDSLILASESGTVKITEGCANAQELETKFASIRSAAEITSDSAEEINSIIQQQTAASGQILITLKQIAAGVENFTAATENVSSSAESLKGIASSLNKQVQMEDEEGSV